MRDRNDWLTSERGTTSSNRQTDQVLQQDGERIKGPWAGQHPTIIQTASPSDHRDAASNALADWQAPSSHLARLVEAVQRSRRFQAPPRRRHHLQLVQEERQ